MNLSVDGFIEEFWGRMARAGLSGLIIVELSAGTDGAVSFDRLEVTQPQRRQQKLGRTALRLLLQLSDESGVALEVIPRVLPVAEPGSTLTDAQLEDFYARRGFKRVSESNRLMRRRPKTHG